MQNLSLQAPQTAPLKKLTDAANKGDGSADKPTSAEPNTSFQMMLSKQVQAKQAQDKQVPVKQTTARQGNGEHVATEQKNKPKVSNSQPGAVAASGNKANTTSTDADPAGNPGIVTIEKVALDPKALLATKEDADTKSEDVAIIATDTNPITLPPAIFAPVMNAVPPVNTQGALSSSAANADSPLTATATQRQQGLDAVLNNALAQGKNANVPEKDAQNIPDVSDGKMDAEHARWLDMVLPNVVKQAAVDEPAGARLVLNVFKDSAIKEMVLPASHQPAAQINTTLPMQQPGSANSINAYPGKSGWDQAISQKVVWMVGAGEQSATLTLNPPDLGPLQVVIHVHNNQADTTFTSDNAEVRQALQDGLSNLRDKMSESGIQLGQANVSSGGQSQQEFQQATQNRSASQLNNNTAASVVEKAAGASTLVRVANGLVDTFA